MSHFLVGVIIPKDTVGQTEDTVAGLLEPYDENTQVQEYDDLCGCVGTEAYRASRTEAENLLGFSFKTWREKYNNLPKHVQPSWKAWYSLFDTVARKLERKHPMYKKPLAVCDECHGTGIRKSTYNPDSKWDFWTIGGRWSGTFTGQHPEDNPANLKPCFICNGTGKRNDLIGKNARLQDPSYTCNGCSGTGKELVWPSQYQGIDNVIAIEDFLKKKDVDELLPFAVVTPDGVWHEKGQMGWFGMTSHEKKQKEWESEMKQLLEQYKDYMIVATDCHI